MCEQETVEYVLNDFRLFALPTLTLAAQLRKHPEAFKILPQAFHVLGRFSQLLLRVGDNCVRHQPRV